MVAFLSMLEALFYWNKVSNPRQQRRFRRVRRTSNGFVFDYVR